MRATRPPTWTEGEIDELILLRERGLLLREIASRMGRSLSSVGNRLNLIARAEAGRAQHRGGNRRRAA